MPVGWFLAPYVLRTGPPPGAPAGVPSPPVPIRYLQVADLSRRIRGEGGGWAATEVLGQRAIVKVRATSQTLALIAALPGVTRFPLARLDDPLGSLTTQQRAALRDLVLSLGYTAAELRAAVGADLATVTLGDVLRFAASRRRKVRRAAGGAIVDDGPDQPVRPLADVDRAVA